MEIKLVHNSPVSATFEIVNDMPYSTSEYKIYLNGKYIRSDITNVFSVFDLNPNTLYELNVNETKVSFTTLEASEVYNIGEFNIDNTGSTLVTEKIQGIIDSIKDNSVLVFPKGVYLVSPLFLKSNVTYYLEKDAIILGELDRYKYPILNAIDNGKVNATWEGKLQNSFASLITIIEQENINIVGEGVINGNADKSDWWVDPKVRRGAWRPNDLFISRSKNINVVGLIIENSPAWTIHPFYSNNLKFIDLTVNADKSSPNTDGCNPDSCSNVLILGVRFNVGDDCIAIKSGKIDMVKDYYQPCQNIDIRNCFMGDGHGGVVFGSEASCGIIGVKVSKCIFKGTDRGLRIKTRRGRGEKAVIENVKFDNIFMDGVKSGFIINEYYYCDSDGKTVYVQDKNKLPVDERTPRLGKFTFKNITAINMKICAGYFYGLPESPIEKITLNNVNISFTADEVKEEYPAMMNDCDLLSKAGFYFYNVKNVKVKKLKISGQNGEILNGGKYE